MKKKDVMQAKEVRCMRDPGPRHRFFITHLAFLNQEWAPGLYSALSYCANAYDQGMGGVFDRRFSLSLVVGFGTCQLHGASSMKSFKKEYTHLSFNALRYFCRIIGNWTNGWAFSVEKSPFNVESFDDVLQKPRKIVTAASVPSRESAN